MESVRKDVECTFGILKCRFRIISHPVPYVSNHRHLAVQTRANVRSNCFYQYGKTWNEYREKIDATVWTCCILHNMLLRHDGLEFLWTEEGTLSWPFADPDLDHRDDFDGPPIQVVIFLRRCNLI
jgi:hypothetical protein